MSRFRCVYKYSNAWTLIVVVCFMAALAVASQTGSSNRVILPAPVFSIVATPSQAYTVWKSKGVRGRTLLLFDEYPHMRGLAYYDGAPRLTDWNLVEFSIFKNIIRKIYFVVPDGQWDEFRRRRDTGMYRSFGNAGKGLYLFTMSGVTLIALPASSLPHIDEQVLVYVNGSMVSRDQVNNLLQDKRISSDCIIMQQGGAS